VAVLVPTRLGASVGGGIGGIGVACMNYLGTFFVPFCLSFSFFSFFFFFIFVLFFFFFFFFFFLLFFVLFYIFFFFWAVSLPGHVNMRI